jgi:hypothetical protein
MALITIPQPDANGEFTTPAEGAKYMAGFGIPQIPLRGKAPWFSEWPSKATLDFEQIDKWYAEYQCNFGSVAKAAIGNHFVVEVDSIDVRARYKADTQLDFTNTLTIRTRQGAHRWFLQSLESLALGNVSQSFVQHEDFSVRVDAEQCVSPGSVHVISGKQYRVIRDTAPVLCSSAELTWLGAQKITRKKIAVVEAGTLIQHGSIHGALVSFVGTLRSKNVPLEAGEIAAMAWVHENCAPPIDEDKVRETIHSVYKYPAGDPGASTVLFGSAASSVAPQAEKPKFDASCIDRSETITKPKFPSWVMLETSIYRGLIEPAMRTSTKRPELIFMPLVATILNSVGTKVRIKGLNNTPLSLFLGSLAVKGWFKSSSAELGFKYMQWAGLSEEHRISTANADGKQLIFTAGSMEGLGINMTKTRCANAILYYDELRSCISKVNIENSSFAPHLLTIYEGGRFANLIKSTRESFAFESGQYCASWIWCSTIKSFHENWPKIMGSNSDLIDRLFIVLGPEKADKDEKASFYADPDCMAGAAETRALIDRALKQGTFDYEDLGQAQTMIAEGLKGLSVVNEEDDDSQNLSLSRIVGLTQKLALFFAIDLGLDSITGDCLERAIALTRYRCDVIRYIRPIEAESTLGRLQARMEHVLRSNSGTMTEKLWKDALNYRRYDTELWARAWKGKAQAQQIVFYTDTIMGRPVKMVGLLKRAD